jgi:hypothetical protein
MVKVWPYGKPHPGPFLPREIGLKFEKSDFGQKSLQGPCQTSTGGEAPSRAKFLPSGRKNEVQRQERISAIFCNATRRRKKKKFFHNFLLPMPLFMICCW